MKRSLVILLGAVLLGATLFAASYFTGQRVCVVCGSNSQDKLAWLRNEFHLNEAEMTRIRQLHDGYMPQCAQMCALIAAKKKELDASLAGQTNVTTEAVKKLRELAELRAECQTRMLNHFMAVNQAMPADEGKRYLAEMENSTLGSHEQIEQTMSAEHKHGNQ